MRQFAAWALARWERVQWHLTLPLRFKLLTKAYQQQEKHLAQVKAHAAKRTETIEHQGKELRSAWAECHATEVKCDALMKGETASGLSPAEVERLALLAMYAGKLAAEANKVLLYGWKPLSPVTRRPGYADVERGLGRVQALAELMAEAGDVRGGEVRTYAALTRERAPVHSSQFIVRGG